MMAGRGRRRGREGTHEGLIIGRGERKITVGGIEDNEFVDRHFY